MTVVAVFILTIILSFAIPEAESTYEIILDRIENALGEHDKVLQFETLRVKKFNRTTYVVSGKYSFNAPVDDTYVMSATGLNMQGGQYRKIMEKFIKQPCTSLYIEPYRPYFEQYQAAQAHPVAWNTCPYPPGPNELKNFLFEDYGTLLPPYIPGGEKWKFEIRHYVNDEMLGGFNIYVVLRSEESLLGH